jgi:hypothetical protein
MPYSFRIFIVFHAYYETAEQRTDLGIHHLYADEHTSLLFALPQCPAKAAALFLQTLQEAEEALQPGTTLCLVRKQERRLRACIS